MTTFVDRLAAKPVVTKENIHSIKKYIAYKYPHHNEQYKAQILAQSIHQIINRELKDFDLQHQEELRTRLLEEALFRQQGAIFCSDILTCCITMDNFSDDILDKLHDWITNKIQEPIHSETITSYRQSILAKDPGVFTEPLAEIPLVEPFFQEDSMQDIVNVSIEDLSNENVRHIQKHHLSLFIALTFILLFVGHTINIESSTTSEAPVFVDFTQPVSTLSSGSFTERLDNITTFYHIPSELRYQSINADYLQVYLIERGSLLGKEPYFSVIMETSKEFHLNPLVLFSIAGHEQGFVPESHPNAADIINNPYNVFESWMNYNTDLKDSSAIASRTITNLLKGLPAGVDPFTWINRRYAEDPDWWRGVRAIYEQLHSIVEANKK